MLADLSTRILGLSRQELILWTLARHDDFKSRHRNKIVIKIFKFYFSKYEFLERVCSIVVDEFNVELLASCVKEVIQFYENKGVQGGILELGWPQWLVTPIRNALCLVQRFA
jgi:hypothetical protein